MGTVNMMVEGTNDVAYFELANKLYVADTGLTLVGEDLSVFPVGEGDQGGTYKMVLQFQHLQAVLRSDPKDQAGNAIRVICLVDNDAAGRGLASKLTGASVGFVLYRDIFLLNRRLPKSTRDPKELEKLIKQENADWKGLDCEVEDLLPGEFLETFVADNPGAIRRDTVYQSGEHHFDFQRDAKARLIRFVSDNAVLEDVQGIIETLKSIRYALGLPPDGVPC